MDNNKIYFSLGGDPGADSIKDYLKISAKCKKIDERRLVLKDMYEAGLIDKADYKDLMEFLLDRIGLV